MDLARRVAPTDASVFITGESGCGKELIAQFIHRHSRRSSRPLIAVNCAALPEALLESEMFGHCKGAFTGAVRDKPGLLEAAHGGTLLLDELVEMSKPIQEKLLRVIQDGVVRRVGSEQTDAWSMCGSCAAPTAIPRGRPVARAARGSVLSACGVRADPSTPPLRERPSDNQAARPTISWGQTGCGIATGYAAAALLRGGGAGVTGAPGRATYASCQNVVEHMVVLLEPGGDIPAGAHPRAERPAGGEGPVWTPPEISTEEPYYAARDRWYRVRVALSDAAIDAGQRHTCRAPRAPRASIARRCTGSWNGTASTASC